MKSTKSRLFAAFAYVICLVNLVIAAVEGLVLEHWAKGAWFLVLSLGLLYTADRESS